MVPAPLDLTTRHHLAVSNCQDVLCEMCIKGDPVSKYYELMRNW